MVASSQVLGSLLSSLTTEPNPSGMVLRFKAQRDQKLHRLPGNYLKVQVRGKVYPLAAPKRRVQ